MRALVVAAVAALTLSPGVTAFACEGRTHACRADVVVFPAYTPEGLWIGSVEAMVRPVPRFALSPTTGQPATVVYNEPDRLWDAVDPDVFLMPLPSARPARIRAVYPTGY